MSIIADVLRLLPQILPQQTQPTAPVSQPSPSQQDNNPAQNPFDDDQFQDLVKRLLGQGEDSFNAGQSNAATAGASDAASAAAAQAAAAPAPAAAAPSTAAVDPSTQTGGPGAQRIRSTIDRMDPQHNPRYQPRGARGTPGRTTYCNQFAQDFMRQVGVPRRDLPTGNANSMNRFLNQQGAQHGWHQVSAAEAQRQANSGHVVLASWNNPSGGHGHVAVVRPGATDGSTHIAQAGGHNYNDTTVSRGFGRHPPQYFVYDGATPPQAQPPQQTAPTQSTPATTTPSTDPNAPPTVQNQPPATQSPTPAVQAPATTNGRTLDPTQQFQSPDSVLSVAIGNAEGTRTPDGGRTRAYGGHSDPGNGAHNLGTFSYQARQNSSVHTPEQADQVQLARLRGQVPAYTAAAQRAGLDPNNPRLQAAYFDLYNQSPRMAQRFLDRMGTQLGGKDLSVENITQARVNACYDDNGRFTSTGLHNPQRAYADQLRRERAIDSVLQRNGAV